MSTPDKGSRRLATDTTHAPADPSRYDDADAVRRALSDADQVHTTKRPFTNLMLPRSPLIGRDHEITTIQQLLLQEQVGLLTLTGPGGVGKTRLAMQVAATLLDHFIDGIYFVSLAPIREADLMIVAIAETLGVREAGGQPLLEVLQAYLQHRQLLLVLDNFEQVVAAASLVASLLAQCSRLKILVTSRATLHLYGEQEFPIPPLALPDPKRLRTMGVDLVPNLAQVASVTLFVQRALAVKPDFALTATNVAVVAEICIGVDGLPLAIELAAAQIKLFSPPALLARLQQRLTLLTGGPQDLPARQRTLRDEIAWSYDLLAPIEQNLFRRLAVFAGGFTLEAAQAVCNAAGDLGVHVLDGVASLVQQNLLKQAEQTRPRGHLEPRFDMLEMMREYALERLIESGEAETIRLHHAHFFLALVVATTTDPTGDFAQLTMEIDNLRVALAWSLGETGQTNIALRLVVALSGFWLITGYSREGRRWSVAALALTNASDQTEIRAKLLLDSAKLAFWQGDAATALPWIEEGMAIARELGAQELLYDGLVYLGWMAQGQNDYHLAHLHLEAALAFARQAGGKLRIADTLIYLAGVVYDERDYEYAQTLYEECLAIFQELEENWSIADTLQYMGQVAQAQGDGARAEALYRNSLTRWRELGLLRWKGVIFCLDGLAALRVGQGHFTEAAHLLAAAEELRAELRGDGVSSSSAMDKHMGLRAQLGETAFAAAWTAGSVLSTEEAVDYALALPVFMVSTSSSEESGHQLLPPMTYPAGLTAREVEVLRLLAQGHTYAQIADQLTISRRTVNAHIISIYSKLEVNSRLEATRFAVEHHMV